MARVCSDCGEEKPDEAFGDPKVNVLTGERVYVCNTCWASGSMW